ncbi:hypothetical protein C2869_18875 [Saccharobesus litoralis]|uniref:Phospholipid/glycerol acyltransferase domain-containing protein n=1 Tax=Saccharobesus litoralis TaxID=2172099 RepID=A0A2S0VVX2_9ALTE|nr:1-acyl-sn-glycerol-3-phosphate acyltransferase [Saccharobesus litoralis]AWB68345.1 hypothetical protein C2869_18875 [Saccharobesus litoralis]
MICHRHYNDNGGLRAVRKSLPHEHGHQQYYDKLDCLYVYSGQVPVPEEEAETWLATQREIFKQAMLDNINAGSNIVIAPEGKSYATEESPQPFKGGIFRLATQAKREPKIVPIAIANFDKNMVRYCPTAIIYPAFKLSEVMDNPADKEQLAAFVEQFSQDFKGYVQQAVALSESQTRAKFEKS